VLFCRVTIDQVRSPKENFWHNTGCLQTQPNKFPQDFQMISTRNSKKTLPPEITLIPEISILLPSKRNHHQKYTQSSSTISKQLEGS